MRADHLLAAVVVIGLTSITQAQPRPQRDGPPRDNGVATTLPGAFVEIAVDGDYRYIRSNGLPNHETGEFPQRRNPNRIAAQPFRFRVTTKPQIAEKPTKLGHQPFGVGLNGVLFDPSTAEWWRDDPTLGWNLEALNGISDLGIDKSNAHVQPGGVYHYHAVPIGLINKLGGKDSKKPILIGWAADGFPMYGPMGYTDPNDANSPLKKLHSSYGLKSGERPREPQGPGGKYDGAYTQDYEYKAGVGDLDECNGRSGVTPEFPQGTYYYVVMNEFPFISRMYRGTPDQSFKLHPRPGHEPPRGFPPDER